MAGFAEAMDGEIGQALGTVGHDEWLFVQVLDSE